MIFRAVIRFVSSLLHKMVDSLAPSVTNLLVRGKTVKFFRWKTRFDEMFFFSFVQVTIGIFGFDEAVIDKPVSSNDKNWTKQQIDIGFRCVQLKFSTSFTVIKSLDETLRTPFFFKNCWSTFQFSCRLFRFVSFWEKIPSVFNFFLFSNCSTEFLNYVWGENRWFIESIYSFLFRFSVGFSKRWNSVSNI